MQYLVFISISIGLLFTSCATKVALPKQTVTHYTATLDIKKSLKVYPEDSVEKQTMNNPSITHVQEGDINLYNIEVDKNLYDAYSAYLRGEGDKALLAIEKYTAATKESKLLWQGAFFKIQVLMMMGQGEDALLLVPSCQKYEELAFDSSLNCKALGAELHFWNQDYQKAKEDASEVLLSIGKWEFPVSYSGPPANMPQLADTITAQMRAYTVMSALYNLQDDYENAYYYAHEAEKRYNAIHYVSNHWLYGKFVHIHLDSYYGRANNLALLASSELALGIEQSKVDADFNAALDFFKMIGYKKGIATTLALKARAYNKMGNHEACYTVSTEALAFALEHGFLDLAWQIGAIRGETLLSLGRKTEAEEAFRKANASIDVLSAALRSDASKRNFGVGKDKIAYRLIGFDIAKKDFKQLFTDLERTRSRAFVDMLSSRTLEFNSQNKTLQQIMLLDKKIRKLKLQNSAKSTKTTQEKLSTMLHQREILAQKLQKEDANLASTVSIYASSLKETQKSLKNGEEIIYFLPLKRSDKVRYLRITNFNVTLESLALTYADLAKSLESMSEILGVKVEETSRGLQKKKFSVVTPTQLHSMQNIEGFISDFRQKLEIEKLFSASKTYIVLSGVTHFIPWGMLDVKNEIAELVNASWINHTHSTKKTSQDIVILANPDFHGVLPQLEGALSEGKSISKLYGSKMLSGADATKEKLYESLQKPTKILHLATHSIFVKGKPLESSIYLSKKGGAYALSAKEIYEKPLNANLVVLSSCESGLGQSINGDDMLGLTRSFFLGGTKSILSSLWEVDDAGTKEFMLVFYKYAKSGNYSLAYQKARASLKRRAYSPAIYGAFVLSGMNDK